MSCIEHTCRECGECWCDNRVGGFCPACGTLSSVGGLYDETYREDREINDNFILGED